MGRLNSLIKFVVVNANVLLFLGGLGIIVVVSLVLTADFAKLAEDYIRVRGVVMLVVGVLVTAMSIIGCMGTNRQIQRDRTWSGRRILSLYQLILVAVVVCQGIAQTSLYSIEVSLEEAAEGLPEEFGVLEGRLRSGFNEAYFDQLCAAESGGESWVWSLAEEHCPGEISRDDCPCATEREPGTPPPASCSDPDRYTTQDCCPNEDLCTAGTEAACPYTACRTGILEALLAYITPARKYSTFVFFLEGLVLTLTCLLICYNPKDSIEDILIKTGALVRPSEGGAASGKNTTLTSAAGRAGGNATKVRSGDEFEIQLIQPKAATVASTSAVREAGGSENSVFLSTPGISPIAVDGGIPSEPLRQFMTAKHEGNNIFYTPDSAPATPGDESYEFNNTGFSALRQKGKAAAICPGRSAAAGPRRAAPKQEAAAAGASTAEEVVVVAPQTEKGSTAGREFASTGREATEHGVATAESGGRERNKHKKKEGGKAPGVIASPPHSVDEVSDAMEAFAPPPPHRWNEVSRVTMAEQSPVAEYEGLVDSSSASSSLEPADEPPEGATEGPTGDPTGPTTGSPTEDAVEDAKVDAMEDTMEDEMPGLLSPVSAAEVVGPPTPQGTAIPESDHPLPRPSRGTRESAPHISPLAGAAAAAGRAHYQMQTPTLTPISGSAWHPTAIDQQQRQSQESPVPEASGQLEGGHFAGEPLEVEHFTGVSPLQGETSASSAPAGRSSFSAQTPISSMHGAAGLPPSSQASMLCPPAALGGLPPGIEQQQEGGGGRSDGTRPRFLAQTPIMSVRGRDPPSFLSPSSAETPLISGGEVGVGGGGEGGSVLAGGGGRGRGGDGRGGVQGGATPTGAPSTGVSAAATADAAYPQHHVTDPAVYDEERKDSAAPTPRGQSTSVRSFAQEGVPVSPLQTLGSQNPAPTAVPTPPPPRMPPLTRQSSAGDSEMGSLSSDSS